MTAAVCTQPACTGQFEDGYCDVCGTPAEPRFGSGPVRSAPTAGVRSASARTGGSSQLLSSPIGSARVSGSRPARRIGSSRTRSQRLGAGITSVPSAPLPDPRSVLMAKAEVAEDKRLCSSCGAPVGRSRDGKPGRTTGFCAKCRTSFSFEPKLKQGDLVGGQYEVVGALAYGGLGWIYLAQDRNVSDRWVVLKGLLNTGDADAYAAAVAERQFLAEVQNPLIVGIYNFALHDGAGYIVMEYVGGSSLKQLLKNRQQANGGHHDPFPAEQAIAYIIEILPAFGYLHSQGLIFCDFKPDNVIQSGDSIKLIDLGGVRRVADHQSAIYGTVGFQAPEVATLGPSVASDIYTIGRTLAVLAMEFRGYQSTYVAKLPPVQDVPLFQRYDSLYRVLAKATAADPNDRFQSADELREQLLAVLREIVVTDGLGEPAHSATPSALFGPPAATGSALEWNELPPLLVDPADPAAAWLAGVSIEDPQRLLGALDRAPQETVEIILARARAAIDAGRFDLAEAAIEKLLTDDPWEWRAVWLSGLSALARLDAGAATTAFNTVLGQVPGELAPKLALALACEHAGERQLAQGLYRTCTIVDANFVAPAAFGLARTRLAEGDVQSALAALDLIGPTSGSYVTARRTRAEVLAGSDAGLAALSEAVSTLARIPIDPLDRQQLVVRVLNLALEHVRNTGRDEPSVRVASVPAAERDLRQGLERAYRELAALTSDRAERVRLVDAANDVRPRTLL
ncbi:MAG: serine/threonine-protein kinase PknG [Pseudonocardiales bacterium]|nr:serine/threonine-protein kinase PknG [Pseudonocardiales bacterium]